MTRYSGVRALDAEIVLDFVEGIVTMDYSLNKLGSPHLSNNSVVITSEWKSLPFLERIKYALWRAGLAFTSVVGVIPVYMVCFTLLVEHGIIIDPKKHQWHHEFLKYYFQNLKGVWEQSRCGDLKDTTLEFRIPYNLWFEYELEGEYRDKIESISLLRNIVRQWVCGKFLQTRQDGWKIVFKFGSVPSTGSCIVRSI